MTDAGPDVVDIAFAVQGERLPRAYRRELAAALEQALPWLAATPHAAVHLLNLSAGGDSEALVSRRTRLALRLPRARAAAAQALCGTRLALGRRGLQVGVAHERELLPFHTLYAHFVTAPEAGRDSDELAFQHRVEAELAARGLPCRAIFGRRQQIEGGTLHGAPVMLDGLTRAAALTVMHEGLGPHRRLGCGIFVPHRSAAAVGMPD